MGEVVETPRAPKAWLMTAIICAALPLLVGVLVLIAFLMSEATMDTLDLWVRVGAAILVGGVGMFCLGLVTLGVYLVKGRRQGVAGRDLAQNGLMTLALLMVNFPVALACIWIAGDSISRVQIFLSNESPTVVEELLITWPGGEQGIGDIAAQETAQVSFLVQGDGEVTFTARQGGAPCEGVLIGYVTPNMGQTNDVVFLGDCQLSVEMR